MFGKIFEQIYDSSIAEDWTVRIVFMDFVVLADIDGVVDRTPESISRRTNVPIDIVKKAIACLEAPDPQSRSPEANGARIVRLDPHRDWGWLIINYPKYRAIASEEQRREKSKNRMQKWRKRKTLPIGDVAVTHGYACDAMKKKMQREMDKKEEGSGEPSFPAQLETAEFKSIWAEWEQHRKELRKPLTATTRQKQLKMLASWGEQTAIKAINLSIASGWQGIFEPKQEKGKEFRL